MNREQEQEKMRQEQMRQEQKQMRTEIYYFKRNPDGRAYANLIELYYVMYGHYYFG